MSRGSRPALLPKLSPTACYTPQGPSRHPVFASANDTGRFVIRCYFPTCSCSCLSPFCARGSPSPPRSDKVPCLHRIHESALMISYHPTVSGRIVSVLLSTERLSMILGFLAKKIKWSQSTAQGVT